MGKRRLSRPCTCPHGTLFESPLLLALLDDGGIVVHELLVVDVLETLSSQVQSKSSAKGWGGGHGKKVDDVLKLWGGAHRPDKDAQRGQAMSKRRGNTEDNW